MSYKELYVFIVHGVSKQQSERCVDLVGFIFDCEDEKIVEKKVVERCFVKLGSAELEQLKNEIKRVAEKYPYVDVKTPIIECREFYQDNCYKQVQLVLSLLCTEKR